MASKRKTAARRGPKKAARAKTAAKKTALAKAGARRKPPRRGREIEPKASGTLGIRGSRSRGARELDLIKPSGTLGAGLTRAAKVAMPATLGAPVREGLAVDVATHIVRAAADGYAGSIEATLEEAGMSTPNLRELFRAGVRAGVVDAGYEIDPAKIPNAANTRLSAVRKAVRAEAH